MQQRQYFQHLSHRINSTTTSMLRHLAGVVILLFPVMVLALSAGRMAHASTPAGFLDMPDEYGKTIYRINADSPRQLYIIGIGHRSPETLAGPSSIVHTQMEIYRIGEWLHKNVDVNLLLPEGYFRNEEKSHEYGDTSVYHSTRLPSPRLDNDFLRQKLGSTTTFVNAEMLLMEYLRLPASQVEDRKIYNAVRTCLKSLNTAGRKSENVRPIAEELRSLQEKRTASILQKIPAVIEKEYHRGTIGNHSALFTIGLNHIEDIHTYIDSNHGYLNSASITEENNSGSRSRLNLLDSGYGITIILPRTLAADSDLLKMTRLDHLSLVSRIDSE